MWDDESAEEKIAAVSSAYLSNDFMQRITSARYVALEGLGILHCKEYQEEGTRLDAAQRDVPVPYSELSEPIA